MSARVLGGIAIAALVGVLAWHAWRSDEDSSGADEGSRPARTEDAAPERAADLTASAHPAAAASVSAVRPSAEPAIDPHEAAFAGELRNAAWAAGAERALRERFGAIRGARLADAECRTQVCRLVVIGSRDQIGRTIAELGGAHGLHDDAATIALTPPEARDDGTYAMRLYARISR